MMCLSVNALIYICLLYECLVFVNRILFFLFRFKYEYLIIGWGASIPPPVSADVHVLWVAACFESRVSPLNARES